MVQKQCFNKIDFDLQVKFLKGQKDNDMFSMPWHESYYVLFLVYILSQYFEESLFSELYPFFFINLQLSVVFDL